MAVMAFGVTAVYKDIATPSNIAAWGTTADTLKASTADTLVLKVTSNYVGKMNLLLFTEEAGREPSKSVVRLTFVKVGPDASGHADFALLSAGVG